MNLLDLRALAYLRRMARALEKSANSQADLARIAVEDWSRKHARRGPAALELGTMDPEEVEKKYQERLAAEEVGVYDEESSHD